MLFNNSNGPITIIYSFLDLWTIYNYELNFVNKCIYKMIERDLHLYKVDDYPMCKSFMINMINNPLYIKFDEYIIYSILHCKNVDIKLLKKIYKYIVEEENIELFIVYVIENDIYELLKFLIEKHTINVEYIYDYLKNRLYDCDSASYNIKTIQILFEHVNFNFNDLECVKLISHNDDNIELIKMLLKYDRIRDSTCETIFLEASSRGNYKIFETLLNIVDPSVCNNYALRYAIKNHNFRIVMVLLDDSRVMSEIRF